MKGEDVMQGVLNGAADGFMNGAITGAITGGMQGAASFMKSSKMMGSLDEASQLAKKPKTSPRCAKDYFVAGTMVKTEEGYKAIEEIEVGDKVWSWDEESGKHALKTVVQLFRNEKDVLVHIEVAGEQIQTTLGHPFYVANKGWIKAGELKAGDVLKLYDGREVEISSVRIKESKPVTTYNFEVEDSHTYYVTQSDVLCHNMCVAREGAFRADVKIGGDPNHPLGHAHIYEGTKNLASVAKDGTVLAGKLKGAAKKFVIKYLDDIARGIDKFYYLK